MSKIYVSLAMFLLLLGCSSKSGSSGGKITTNVRLSTTATNVSSFLGNSLPLQGMIYPHQASALSGGANSTSGLSSLKYFFTQLSICQSMTTTNTAFSNQSGCISLYTGPTDSALNPSTPISSPGTTDLSSQAIAARTTTTGYLDLMSATDRATIGATPITLASTDAGDYYWGVVNWAYPIKVKATVTAGSTPLYTHDGTVSVISGGSENGYKTTASTAFTSAPAEEAVVVLNNGGTWFRFQNPFTVNATDNITLDLAFNPDSLILGYTGTGTPTNVSLYDGTPGGASTSAFRIPFLDLTPIPRTAGDTTMVETYTTTSITGTTDIFNIRIELYYVKSDTAKTIYGVLVRSLPTALSTTSPPDLNRVSFVTTNSDSTINFLDYSRASIIPSFTRKTTVGDTTTVSIPCGGSTSAFSPTGCSAGSNVTAIFSLTSVKELN